MTLEKLEFSFKYHTLWHCELSKDFLSIDTVLHIFCGDIRYLMYCLNFSCLKISGYIFELMFFLQRVNCSFCCFHAVLKNSQQPHRVMEWHFILKTCQGCCKTNKPSALLPKGKQTEYYRDNCQVPNYVHCLSHLQWLIIYLSSKHSFLALSTALQ